MDPQDLTDEARALVARMTLAEKTSLCSGDSFWGLQKLPRLGLEGTSVSDGPHGLRRQDTGDHLGMRKSTASTCFPAGGTLAQSWDPALCHQIAGALARECLAHGVSILLGPAINLKRHPCCGRSFECHS
jgi:beta-glucosidase